MTTIPMPTFVKTVFDSFPLVKLPPLRPITPEDPTSYTVPTSSSSSLGSALPTLFVLPNHPNGLAIQLLLQKCSARLQETIRVSYTTQQSNQVHPYIVLPQNETLESAALSRWLNRSIGNHKNDSDGMDKTKDVDSIAFESLLIDLDDTMTLAQYLDTESTRILGPWHAQLFKPTAQVSRLLSTGWDRQVRTFSDAIHALQTYVQTSDSSENAEAMSGSSWVNLQVVAYVHILTNAEAAQKSIDKHQAELKRIVDGCGKLTSKCSELMKDVKDKVLF